ncbi:P-loop containing nucleoside triphosphate hydrolase protein [Coemansia reversa NRRL 1564]|uniref:P-loop containing nucleoside triphosphate hydrolase protein n=1 Tax=Coemansia reversa (strain ATCC 12441 / NRRL 1564) TaxID=763665 RepID=A0A2G5BG67_COERN|nr:P-loop containing nucleoside triphosphate hydrolase protein [Coemansia reversa NRRL 1564]|eukprot:PIA17697.1 P-loop containing nucleoside triphosphate hydrolase protein [Coemansia reversa NRRL 1564]
MICLDAAPAQPQNAQPILSWNNLNYDVKVKDGTRRILHDISGSIYPGELVAIMGASGAGKTTLLSILSGRVKGGRLEGEIKFQGAKRNPHTFKRLLAYVEQEDLMYPSLTVEETLMASAQLRLPNGKYSLDDKKERVNTLLRQLRLSQVKDTLIGDHEIRGVSGGERKRVSIGAELVTDPAILMLDEPSSGLDSSSAEMVVTLAKEMSRKRNLCTLMTIHQPSTEMVAQFDKLILLAQGKLVYMGPANQAVRYFDSLGYPSTNSNPASFFIDLMNIDFSSTEAMKKSEERVQSLADLFVKFQDSGAKLLPESDKEVSGDSGISTIVGDITEEQANLVLMESPPMNSWLSEMIVLLKRDWAMTKRSRSFVWGMAAECLVMMLFVGFVFFQLKKDQASVQNRVGALFFMTLMDIYPVIIPAMVVIMVGRKVLFRERSSGTYRMTTYFFARALSLMPVFFIPYMIMYIGIYFISHLQYHAGKFFIHMALNLVLLFCSIGYAFMMAMIVNRIDIATTIAPVSLACFILFAGNLANANAITPVLRWIKYFCIVFYTYSGLMQNELHGLEFICDPDDFSCYKDGAEVIEFYGLDVVPIWATIVINLALGIGFYIIAYCLLRWATKPRFLWI